MILIIAAVIVVLILIIGLWYVMSTPAASTNDAVVDVVAEPYVQAYDPGDGSGHCRSDCAKGTTGSVRTLQSHIGDMTYAQCAAAAKDQGKKYFGLQWCEGVSGATCDRAQCWVGDTYNDDGSQADAPRSGACGTNPDGKLMGRACSNAVYEWKNLPSEHFRGMKWANPLSRLPNPLAVLGLM
jgi:hypothetical protein